MERKYTTTKPVEIEIQDYDTSHLDNLTGHVSDYQYSDTTALAPRQPQRYVAGSPTVNIQPANLGSVEYNIAMPTPATTHVETRGTHVDRGLEFLLKTSVLAVVLGVLTATVTVICWNSPITGAATVLAFLVVFAGVWLYAYSLSTANSSEGIARLQAETQCNAVGDVMDARLEDYRERARLERQLFARQHNLTGGDSNGG